MYRFIETLSFRELRDMFEGDESLYIDFLQACVGMFADKTIGIKQAISDRNFAALSAIRHSMKPTLQSLELHALTEAFAALQETDEHWPQEASELLPALAELKRQLELEMER